MVTDDFGQMVATPSTTLREQIDANAARMTRIEVVQADTAASIDRMEGDLLANTKATQETASSTAELVGILNALKGAFKTLDFMGKLAKPLGYIVTLGAAIAGMYAAFKTGGTR